MGWGRTFLLGDIGNRLDIEDTEAKIELLKRELGKSYRKNSGQDTKLNTLIKENMEMKLYLASLIRVLAKQGVLSIDEFKQDGWLD